jgi:hypothetical protein
MTNTYSRSPELVLNFKALTGLTRRTIASYIQTRLFELGYRWNVSGETLQYLNAGLLHVNSWTWNPKDITFMSDSAVNGLSRSESTVRQFDAATEAEEFLEEARRALITEVVENIRGVSVTITREGVKLDATALLGVVAAEAEARRTEVFA